MLDPHLKAMLDQAAAMPQIDPETIPAEMFRAGYKAMSMMGAQNAYADQLDIRDLKVAGGAGEIPARLYTPKGAASPGPGVVFYHGGGFVIGDLDTHDALCRRLAVNGGFRVIAIDYRLAPENPFPAPHDDCLAATKWVFDHAAEIGFDPKRVAIAGDSAGGNLAASVAIDLKDDPARKIAFQFLMYPVTSPEVETGSRTALGEGYFLTKKGMDFFERCLAAFGHKDANRAFVHRAEDLTGLPPAFVATAGFDPLKDEGKSYAERLKAAGVDATHKEYPAFIHGFYNMDAVSPAAGAAVDEAAGIIRKALG